MNWLNWLIGLFSQENQSEINSRDSLPNELLPPLADPELAREKFYSAALLEQKPPFENIDKEFLVLFQKIDRYVNLCQSPAKKHNVDFQMRLAEPFSRFKKAYCRFAILWSLVKVIDKKMKGGLDETTRKALNQEPCFARFLGYIENFVLKRLLDDSGSMNLMYLCMSIDSQFDSVVDAMPDPRTVPKYVFREKIVAGLEEFLNYWGKTLENDQAFPEGKPEREMFFKPEELELEISREIKSLSKTTSGKLILRLAPPVAKDDERKLILVFDEFSSDSKKIWVGSFEFGGKRIEHSFMGVTNFSGNTGRIVTKKIFGNIKRFDCGLIIRDRSPRLSQEENARVWKAKFSQSSSGEVYNTVVYCSDSIELTFEPDSEKILIEAFSSMDDST